MQWVERAKKNERLGLVQIAQVPNRNQLLLENCDVLRILVKIVWSSLVAKFYIQMPWPLRRGWIYLIISIEQVATPKARKTAILWWLDVMAASNKLTQVVFCRV